jgi:hypothetical protein
MPAGHPQSLMAIAGVPGKPRSLSQPLRQAAALIAIASLGNVVIDLWPLRGILDGSHREA